MNHKSQADATPATTHAAALRTLAPAAAILLAGIAAGCSHHAITTTTQPTPAATAGQPLPYTIVQTEPAANGTLEPRLFHVISQLPAPVGHTNRRYLHLLRQGSTAYLVDRDGNRYHACRDRSGHLYPASWDPSSQQYVPLYYDSSRDCYYSVARSGPSYYRSYVDDVDYEDNYYEDPGIDYDNYVPASYDQPIIYAPGYVYPYQGDDYEEAGYGNYGDGDYGDYTVYHRRHEEWLWAIPVIAVAYVLLEPRHHDHNDHNWATITATGSRSPTSRPPGHSR